MSSPISLILVDDHTVVRQGIRTLISTDPGFTVLAEAGGGEEALVLVEKHRPDVLVVDLVMPGINGLELVQRVRKLAPEVRCVVLSMYANEAYVLEALRAGALGYVLKSADAVELVRAAREVMAGRRYLSPPLSERAIEAYLHGESGQANPFTALTRREREIVELVVKGLTSNEIGDELAISPRTVEKHRSNVMGKLGLRSQADLIRRALEHGIGGTGPTADDPLRTAR